jgi:hypothetical protein
MVHTVSSSHHTHDTLDLATDEAGEMAGDGGGGERGIVIDGFSADTAPTGDARARAPFLPPFDGLVQGLRPEAGVPTLEGLFELPIAPTCGRGGTGGRRPVQH